MHYGTLRAHVCKVHMYRLSNKKIAWRITGQASFTRTWQYSPSWLTGSVCHSTSSIPALPDYLGAPLLQPNLPVSCRNHQISFMILGGFFFQFFFGIFVVELSQADKLGNLLQFDFLRLASPQVVCRPRNWVESVYGIYKEICHTYIAG